MFSISAPHILDHHLGFLGIVEGRYNIFFSSLLSLSVLLCDIVSVLDVFTPCRVDREQGEEGVYSNSKQHLEVGIELLGSTPI